jgi:hypothetical protein
MFLLVGLYQEANPKRAAEFAECVRRNALNPHIAQLTVFLEGGLTAELARATLPSLNTERVVLIEHGRRVTFNFLIEYANRNLAGRPVILANTDICFDETLELISDITLDGQLLCLSRWDEATDGSVRLYEQANSQDAWVFEPPLPRIPAPFGLGMPGCDNRLAYEAERVGLALSNPSRSVRARHLHLSGVRNYTSGDRIPGPYRFVPPSFLGSRTRATATTRQGIEQFPSHRGRRSEELAETRYRDLKQLLAQTLGTPLSSGLRRELHSALISRMEQPSRDSSAPLAAVTFREVMGYQLACLVRGATTHWNDSRPLVAITPELEGLRYTQVVANHAAPVEITFQSAGRLYVLAARGWEGYEPAAAFLDDAGWREPLEPLRTQDGTVFDVWSLEAGEGERITVPTQVMLVGRELSKVP